jgi:hypothetical protein
VYTRAFDVNRQSWPTAGPACPGEPPTAIDTASAPGVERFQLLTYASRRGNQEVVRWRPCRQRQMGHASGGGGLRTACPGRLASCVHGVADLIQAVFEEVPVGVEGHRRRHMTQHSLYRFDVGSAGDREAHGRVPKLVGCKSGTPIAPPATSKALRNGLSQISLCRRSACGL